MRNAELMPKWARQNMPKWIERQNCPKCNGGNCKIEVEEITGFVKTVEVRQVCEVCGLLERKCISEYWTEWEKCPRCKKPAKIVDMSVRFPGEEDIVISNVYKSVCCHCGFEETFAY